MIVSSAVVTGAGGFLGRHLVAELARREVPTCALTRSPDRLSEWLGEHVNNAGCVRIQLLKSYAADHLRSALASVRAEVVFHLAACGVQPRVHDPEVLFAGNVATLQTLARLTSDWNLRLLISTGSCAEYGASPADRPSLETDALAPRCLYGASKAAATLLGLGLAAEQQLPFVCLRLFGAFGPGEHPQRLIPYLIEQLRQGNTAELTPGRQLRDFTFAADTCQALLAAATSQRILEHRVYNVCSGQPTSVRHVGKTVAACLQANEQLLQWGAREPRPEETPRLVGDPARFADVTGWKARTSLSAGIQKMIQATQSGTLRMPEEALP